MRASFSTCRSALEAVSCARRSRRLARSAALREPPSARARASVRLRTSSAIVLTVACPFFAAWRAAPRAAFSSSCRLCSPRRRSCSMASLAFSSQAFGVPLQFRKSDSTDLSAVRCLSTRALASAAAARWRAPVLLSERLRSCSRASSWRTAPSASRSSCVPLEAEARTRGAAAAAGPPRANRAGSAASSAASALPAASSRASSALCSALSSSAAAAPLGCPATSPAASALRAASSAR
mmetsp:Transcript_25119/g.78887  ORF Transcript_25119/g.78887 Transcript_25119/m.78887 type:complete len:238 (-) Transcript_25119:562-1275(-)